jgi:hypothetical protein
VKSTTKGKKMATNEPQSSVSATELAQALTEALQKRTPLDQKAKDAIKQYKAISDDLQTLPLSQ